MNTQKAWTDFQRELLQNIRSTIRRLERGGTVAMGKRDLLQVTPTPKTCAGAPIGGNLEWQYANLFDATLQGLTSKERAFIY
jgi:hypothetical protein